MAEFDQALYEAALKDKKIIVLYFYANWCPLCKAEVPYFYESVAEFNNADIVGFRVNFNDNETDDDEKNLARKFGVAYQHTKVILKNGERVLKSPESWDEKRYDQEISKLL